MEKKKKYLDYDSIKNAVSVYDVLTKHYNWERFLEVIAEGRAYTGECPICRTKIGSPFRVSIEEDGKDSWSCLAKCNAGGNVLDLVATKEKTDIHEAAFLIATWFNLLPESPENGMEKPALEGKGYLRELDKELEALLSAGDDAETIRFVKEKVLESYRNGQKVEKISA